MSNNIAIQYKLIDAIEFKLLSIFMRSNNVKPKISDSLNKDDFLDEKHQIIFEAINDLYYKDGKSLDNDILCLFLGRKNLLDKAGGKKYINKIYSNYIGDTFYLTYIEYISESSKIAKLKSFMEFATIQLKLEQKKSGEILEAIQLKLSELFTISSDEDFKHINELTQELIERVHELKDLKDGITGISTGYPDLDNLTDGLHPGELIILAARPSMGKTAFALNILSNIIKKYKDTIHKTAMAFFSLEMPNIQLMSRLSSIISAIPLKKILTGKEMLDQDWEKLNFISKIAEKVDVYFNDTSLMNISKIHFKLKSLIRKNPNLKVVIIDYLQLISSSNENSFGESRQNEISKISRGLKIIARELNITIICLSQLSRAVEQRPDKKPLLSDLRDSGSIEQDADLVLLLYRESYYSKMSENHGGQSTNNPGSDVTELILAKNRNGPVGKVYLQFNSHFGQFVPSKFISNKPIINVNSNINVDWTQR